MKVTPQLILLATRFRSALGSGQFEEEAGEHQEGWNHLS